MDTVYVVAPPSKSLSHRAVIAAALADGTSQLKGVLDSDDLRRTREALVATGCVIEEEGDVLSVRGRSDGPQGGRGVSLNMHESGTSCRLLTAVVVAGRGQFRIHGAPRLHDRPLGGLIDALAEQQVHFLYEAREGYPPVVLTTTGLPGGEVHISLSESSQYLSGLLLAAPLARQPLTVNIVGDQVVSWPYVALTAQVMADFGVPCQIEQLQRGQWREVSVANPGPVRGGETRFLVRPGSYRAQPYQVEGDWSNASYFLAAGAIGPRAVAMTGLRRDSLQGDREILGILEAMGAHVQWRDDVVTVSPSQLRGVDVDMGSCPDLVPTVAVLACFAEGETTISNVAHLRLKECDRLAAPAAELAKVGCVCEVRDDGLRLVPPAASPRPAQGNDVNCATYGDHRMAMSLSLLELAGLEVHLDDPACVGKSFPGFWDSWRQVRTPAPALLSE
jgi:3-phosphoshikimate 1-carboxyvinyltransferase